MFSRLKKNIASSNQADWDVNLEISKQEEFYDVPEDE